MPTLPNGTLALADREAYEIGRNGLKRGDIVLMKSPIDPSQEFVKRVIALPGDVIEIDGTLTPPQVVIQQAGHGAFQVLDESICPRHGPFWTTAALRTARRHPRRSR